MHLTHIRLLVSDFDACFRFYRDVMGLEAVWGEEGSGYADFKVGEGLALALFERQAQAEAVGTDHLPSKATSQDRVSLVFGSDDLDADFQSLKGRGVQVVAEPADHPEWGIRVAYLRDPDGNLIEINSPIPHEEWTDELKAEAQKYENRTPPN